MTWRDKKGKHKMKKAINYDKQARELPIPHYFKLKLKQQKSGTKFPKVNTQVVLRIVDAATAPQQHTNVQSKKKKISLNSKRKKK